MGAEEPAAVPIAVLSLPLKCLLCENVAEPDCKGKKLSFKLRKELEEYCQKNR